MRRKEIGRRAVVVGAGLLFAGSVMAQVIVLPDDGVGSLRTPAAGTAERAALMDAARAPIGQAVGLPVVFVVQVLNTDGHWAYLQAVPHNPDGSPIDWRKTHFAQDIAAGWMSDIAMVLLRRDQGTWQVVDWIMGPTDVAWYGWVEGYGLPERLFR